MLHSEDLSCFLKCWAFVANLPEDLRSKLTRNWQNACGQNLHETDKPENTRKT